MVRNMGACDRLAGETHIFTEDSARFIHGHGRAFKNQKWQAFLSFQVVAHTHYSVHMDILTQWPHVLFSICLFGIRYITNFQPVANFLPLCNALCWGDLSKVCLRNGFFLLFILAPLWGHFFLKLDIDNISVLRCFFCPFTNVCFQF